MHVADANPVPAPLALLDLPDDVHRQILAACPSACEQAGLALASRHFWNLIRAEPGLAMVHQRPALARPRLLAHSRRQQLVPDDVATFVRDRPFLREAVAGTYHLELGGVFTPLDVSTALAGLLAADPRAHSVCLESAAAVGPRPGRAHPADVLSSAEAARRPRLRRLTLEGRGQLQLTLHGPQALDDLEGLARELTIHDLGGLHLVGWSKITSLSHVNAETQALHDFVVTRQPTLRLRELSIEACPRLASINLPRSWDLSRINSLSLRGCEMLGDGCFWVLDRMPGLVRLDTRGTAVDLDELSPGEQSSLARLTLLDGEAPNLGGALGSDGSG